jgi:hypothetical protein
LITNNQGSSPYSSMTLLIHPNAETLMPAPPTLPTRAPTRAPTPLSTRAPTPAPIPLPTPAPTPLMAPTSLMSFRLNTTLAQNNGNAGNMFDMKAKNDMIITGFDVHLNKTGINFNAKVYHKFGTWNGFEYMSNAWKLIMDVPVSNSEVQGIGKYTPLPPLGSPIIMTAGSRRAFYITLTTTGMRYTNGNNATASFPYVENPHFQIFQGTGNSWPFNKTNYPRV